MARSDDLLATIARLRADVDELQRLGASRWGAANPTVSWAEVARVVNASLSQGSISTIVDVTGMSVTFTGTANRKWLYLMRGHTFSTVANDRITYYITDELNNIITTGSVWSISGAAGTDIIAIYPTTSVAGTVTRKLRAARTVGTGAVTAYADSQVQCVLEIIDVGPA